jgi:hypothetical protein
MGFRFRRTLKILPGVRINLSRSGLSSTVGVQGASVTVGKRGTYANVGVPGSGVSYRTKVGPGVDEAIDAVQAGRARHSALPVFIIAALLIGAGVIAFNALNKLVAPSPAGPVTIAATPSKIQARETVRITKRTTTVRADASRKSGKLGIAHQGEEFTVFARKGVWLQVGHDDPQGWIAASATR